MPRTLSLLFAFVLACSAAWGAFTPDPRLANSPFPVEISDVKYDAGQNATLISGRALNRSGVEQPDVGLTLTFYRGNQPVATATTDLGHMLPENYAYFHILARGQNLTDATNFGANVTRGMPREVSVTASHINEAYVPEAAVDGISHFVQTVTPVATPLVQRTEWHVQEPAVWEGHTTYAAGTTFPVHSGDTKFPIEQLQVRSHRFHQGSEVTGLIHNVTNENLSDIWFKIIFFDQNGSPLDTVRTHVNHIGPGQTVAFTENSRRDDLSNWASYVMTLDSAYKAYLLTRAPAVPTTYASAVVPQTVVQPAPVVTQVVEQPPVVTQVVEQAPAVVTQYVEQPAQVQLVQQVPQVQTQYQVVEQVPQVQVVAQVPQVQVQVPQVQYQAAQVQYTVPQVQVNTGVYGASYNAAMASMEGNVGRLVTFANGRRDFHFDKLSLGHDHNTGMVTKAAALLKNTSGQNLHGVHSFTAVFFDRSHNKIGSMNFHTADLTNNDSVWVNVDGLQGNFRHTDRYELYINN